MPQLTNLLLQNGIPEEAVAWLFVLPIAVTFVVAARQLVGIKGLGIAAPLLIAFAISSLGIQAGIMTFAVALIISFGVRIILTKVRLLTLPKSGLIIVSAVLGLALIIPFLPYKENMDMSFAGFSFVVVVLSMEQFAALLLERGPRRTFVALVETSLIAIPASFLIDSNYLKDFVFRYPVFIFLGLIILNLLFGKWTGLRVSELIRFKSIIFK